jgi:hypothetical protein
MGLRWRFIEGHTFAVPRCALTCHASGPPTASAQFHVRCHAYYHQSWAPIHRTRDRAGCHLACHALHERSVKPHSWSGCSRNAHVRAHRRSSAGVVRMVACSHAHLPCNDARLPFAVAAASRWLHRAPCRWHLFIRRRLAHHHFFNRVIHDFANVVWAHRSQRERVCFEH